MEKTYTIHTDSSGLRIELNPKRPFIILLGLGVLAVFYGGSALFLLGTIAAFPPRVSEIGDMIVPLLILLTFTGFYLLMGRAFMRRLSQYEVITIDGRSLTITDRSLVSKKVKRFDLTHVREIVFAGTENYTPHPLDGNYADIGFRGMEGLVQYTITDGTIVLLYAGQQIRFGRNIPSWDAEEIIKKIEQYTGRSFTPVKIAEAEPAVRKYRGGV